LFILLPAIIQTDQTAREKQIQITKRLLNSYIESILFVKLIWLLDWEFNACRIWIRMRIKRSAVFEFGWPTCSHGHHLSEAARIVFEPEKRE
jgi:hypothetical protein